MSASPDASDLRIRRYGATGPFVVLVHGGPAAAGTMAPVARALAGSFRVLEPYQRGSGPLPLTVARHVADLQGILVRHCDEERPAVVGHSWGAMLALAHAAEHPASVAALVLVGCGTFDLQSRARMREILNARMDASLRRKLERLSEEIPDADERLRRTGDLLQSVYNVDPVDSAADDEVYDETAHRETWQDMLRQQESGVYPAAFAAIRFPVLMLHGTEDPHPGTMIHDGLRPFLPQLEYREWARCGHYPWLERSARDDFFRTMQAWLKTHTTSPPDGTSGERAR